MNSYNHVLQQMKMSNITSTQLTLIEPVFAIRMIERGPWLRRSAAMRIRKQPRLVCKPDYGVLRDVVLPRTGLCGFGVLHGCVARSGLTPCRIGGFHKQFAAFELPPSATPEHPGFCCPGTGIAMRMGQLGSLPCGHRSAVGFVAMYTSIRTPFIMPRRTSRPQHDVILLARLRLEATGKSPRFDGPRPGVPYTAIVSPGPITFRRDRKPSRRSSDIRTAFRGAVRQLQSPFEFGR